MKPHHVLDLYSIYVLFLVLIIDNLKFLKGYSKLIYRNNVFGTKIHRYSSTKTTRYNGILIQSQLRIQTKRKDKKILCKSPLVLILHGWIRHGKMENMSSLLKEESLDTLQQGYGLVTILIRTWCRSCSSFQEMYVDF